MAPRLASGFKVSALLRRVDAAGGFGAVLEKGDTTAGSIAVITREHGETRLLVPQLAPSGAYEFQAVAAGDAIPAWIERARRNDPDLWVVELDIPDAARFVAETLSAR